MTTIVKKILSTLVERELSRVFDKLVAKGFVSADDAAALVTSLATLVVNELFDLAS